MRLLFRLMVAVYAGAWVVAVVRLPAEVPLHFGATGVADRWGSRTEALVFFGVLGVGMTALFEYLPRRVSRTGIASGWLNLPYKQWWLTTPERAREATRRLLDDLWLIGALVMALLSAVLLLTVRAAEARPAELGASGWSVIGVFLALLLGWTVWMTTGRYRPEEGR